MFSPSNPFPTDEQASTASNSTTLSRPSASLTQTTSVVTPSSAPPVIDISSNSNKLATGGIVGLALGAVGVLIFLALGLLVWHDRRKRRRQRTKSFDGADNITADPWVYNHPPQSPFLSPPAGHPAFNFGTQAPVSSSGKGGMVFVPMANLEGDLDGRRPQSLYSIEPPDTDVPSSVAGGAGGYAAGPSNTNDPRYFPRSDYSPSASAFYCLEARSSLIKFMWTASNAPTHSAWRQ